MFQTVQTLGFPVFCLGFSPNGKLLLGGGGGATKAGVKNTCQLYTLDESTGSLSLVAEQEFSKADDGCMSLAVHPLDKVVALGVNAPESQIAMGENGNCRCYVWSGNRFTHLKSFKTLHSTDPFHHQKIVQFSRNGKHLLAGTTEGRLLVYSWPDLKLAFEPLDPGNEVYDAQFNPSDSSSLALLTAKKCMMLSTSSGKVQWMNETPSPVSVACEFRAARFGTGPSKDVLFVVTNAKARKQSFISQYVPDQAASGGKEWRLLYTNQVAKKPITAFTLSNDGELMAFGSSDLTIHVLTTQFQFVTKIEQAHGFPVTALAFSPTSKCIVSGSADGTCRISSIPPPKKSRGLCGSILLLVLLILFLIAALYVLLTSTDSPAKADL